MKIEPEPVDIFGMKGSASVTKKAPPKINQKLNKGRHEDQKYDYD